MAFGKPALQTANVGGWRQRAGVRQNDKTKTMGSSRGFAGSRFSNQFKPPIGVTTLVRIIPGQYKVQRAVEIEPKKWGLKTEQLEYYETAEHYDGRTGQSTICSAGAVWFRKEFAQACIGCRGYFAAPRGEDGRRKGRFNRREIYIFTVLEYGPFLKVEQIDANGLVKLSEKTGKPYTEWKRKSECYGYTVLEEKEGHIQHWTVGHGHMEVIQGYDALIGRTCINCGSPDTIRRDALLCSNPKCGTDVVDCHSTAVTPADQDKMLYTDVECPFCHTTAPLQEALGCTQCNNPVRASIFDVDINMQRIDTTGTTQLVFSSWSKPHPIDPSYKVRPLDLPAIFKPDDIKTQERRFQMTLEDAERLGGEEFSEEEARQHTRAYA